MFKQHQQKVIIELLKEGKAINSVYQYFSDIDYKLTVYANGIYFAFVQPGIEEEQNRIIKVEGCRFCPYSKSHNDDGKLWCHYQLNPIPIKLKFENAEQDKIPKWCKLIVDAFN